MTAIQDLPPVEFTAWCPWPARTTLGCRKQPGVYVLAFDVDEGQRADVLDSRMVYIGETCRELARRWRYFEYAARGDDAPHSGGRTFRQLIEHPVNELLVAAWAPSIEDKVLRSAYIRYVERKLLLDWVLRHGRLPLCNRE